MKRSFSRRETILLVILAILLLAVGYYMAVDMPVRDAISEAKLRELAAEDEMMVERVRLEKMEEMQAALAEISDEESAVVPDYDNSGNVIRLLGEVLQGAGNYNLDFEPVVFTEKIAARTVNMTFTCAGYPEAEQIIRALYHGGYRMEVDSMRFSVAGADEEGGLLDRTVTANVSVTFFEYMAAKESEGAPEAEQETQEAQ